MSLFDQITKKLPTHIDGHELTIICWAGVNFNWQIGYMDIEKKHWYKSLACMFCSTGFDLALERLSKQVAEHFKKFPVKDFPQHNYEKSHHPFG